MRRAFVIALLVLAAVPLLTAVAELPPVGSEDSPAYTHVVSRYLEHGAEETGSENLVTAIILDYRGYDTGGEVTVIFTAAVAVLGIMALTRGRRDEEEARETGPAETFAWGPHLPASPVVLLVIRAMAPFVAMFAAYLMLRGHHSPGGGFQGGTILGALVIVTSLVIGQHAARDLLPERARPALSTAAVLAFALVGLAGLTYGAYLQLPPVGPPEWPRLLSLTLLEIGIGVGGATIIASLFAALEQRTHAWDEGSEPGSLP